MFTRMSCYEENQHAYNATLGTSLQGYLKPIARDLCPLNIAPRVLRFFGQSQNGCEYCKIKLKTKQQLETQNY